MFKMKIYLFVCIFSNMSEEKIKYPTYDIIINNKEYREIIYQKELSIELKNQLIKLAKQAEKEINTNREIELKNKEPKILQKLKETWGIVPVEEVEFEYEGRNIKISKKFTSIRAMERM